jgi:tetratricopeptide (TPR) repeat protein
MSEDERRNTILGTLSELEKRYREGEITSSKERKLLLFQELRRLGYNILSSKESTQNLEIVLAHIKDVEALYSVHIDLRSPELHDVEKLETYNVAYRLAVEIARHIPKEQRKEIAVVCARQTGEAVMPPTPPELEAWEWINKGVGLYNLDRLDDAIRCLDKAIKINPQYAEAWYNKGTCLNRLGFFDEAIKCYDKALEINPTYAEAWINKGLAEDMLNRSQDAAESYKRFLQLVHADQRYVKQIEHACQRLEEIGCIGKKER